MLETIHPTKDHADNAPAPEPTPARPPTLHRTAPTRSVKITDASLIADSFRDPAAFTRIFDRHWERLHRFCTGRAGAAGEDLAAETFRVAYDQRRRYDPTRADAGPWLFGIATNLLRHHFRSAARAQDALARIGSPVEPDPSEDALVRAEAAVLGPALGAALRTLSAAERDALLLYAWAGLAYGEIAIALDVPIGTVRSRIHSARAGMRTQLSTTVTKDHA